MKENQGKSTLVRVSEAWYRLSESGVRSGRKRERARPFFLVPTTSKRSLEQARVDEASGYRDSTVDGTRVGGGEGVGGVTTGNSWWGCAYFRPKNVIFHTPYLD